MPKWNATHTPAIASCVQVLPVLLVSQGMPWLFCICLYHCHHHQHARYRRVRNKLPLPPVCGPECQPTCARQLHAYAEADVTALYCMPDSPAAKMQLPESYFAPMPCSRLTPQPERPLRARLSTPTLRCPVTAPLSSCKPRLGRLGMQPHAAPKAAGEPALAEQRSRLCCTQACSSIHPASRCLHRYCHAYTR